MKYRQCLPPLLQLLLLYTGFTDQAISLADINMCVPGYHCVGKTLISSPSPPPSLSLSASLPPLSSPSYSCVYFTFNYFLLYSYLFPFFHLHHTSFLIPFQSPTHILCLCVCFLSLSFSPYFDSIISFHQKFLSNHCYTGIDRSLTIYTRNDWQPVKIYYTHVQKVIKRDTKLLFFYKVCSVRHKILHKRRFVQVRVTQQDFLLLRLFSLLLVTNTWR